jgi:predicted membrane-bound spermidine synthase
MPTRLRKLIGSLALLALIAIWIVLSVAIAYAVFRFENPFLAILYYVIAGIGWVVPAMPLVSWTLRRHPERP